MNHTNKIKSVQESSARQKFLEGIHLQEMEGNPLTSDEIEMFEMFHREGWSDDKCREYILKRFNEKRMQHVSDQPSVQ